MAYNTRHNATTVTIQTTALSSGSMYRMLVMPFVGSVFGEIPAQEGGIEAATFRCEQLSATPTELRYQVRGNGLYQLI